MSDVRLLVLCNNELALPALQELFRNGALRAVMVPDKNGPLYALLEPLLRGTGVRLERVRRQELGPAIRRLAGALDLTAGWLMTFPYILPPEVLRLLPGGFVNFHYGLLPQYRGPNPVLAQMLGGESFGGITLHLVDEGVDTGPVVLQRKIPIEDNDTFGLQLAKLGQLGAVMALRLLELTRRFPVLPSAAQNVAQAGFYPRPVAADLMVDWNRMGSRQILRLIHACNPWNKGAGAVIGNRGIRLTAAEIMPDTVESAVAPGTILRLDGRDGPEVACRDSRVIRITVISTDEGFFTGDKISYYGVRAGDRFAL